MTRGAGIEAAGRMLATLLRDDRPTVAAWAVRHGIARSTAFAVMRRLASARLIDRDAQGRIAPGEAAIALALARSGLASLHGPAGAVVRWLRDETGCDARVTGAERDLVLAELAAGPASPAGTTQLVEPIRRADGQLLANVSLAVPVLLDAAARAHARDCLRKAALTLDRFVRADP